MTVLLKRLLSLTYRRRPYHISHRHKRRKYHLHKAYDCAWLSISATAIDSGEPIVQMANELKRRHQPIQGVHGNKRVKHPPDQRPSAMCCHLVQKRARKVPGTTKGFCSRSRKNENMTQYVWSGRVRKCLFRDRALWFVLRCLLVGHCGIAVVGLPLRGDGRYRGEGLCVLAGFAMGPCLSRERRCGASCCGIRGLWRGRSGCCLIRSGWRLWSFCRTGRRLVICQGS